MMISFFKGVIHAPFHVSSRQKIGGAGHRGLGVRRVMSLERLEERRLLATVQGQKFHDFNANAQRDPGEPGLNDWTIELRDTHEGSEGALVASATTGDVDLDGNGVIDPETESGWYSITDVAAGTYVVNEVLQPGWVQSTSDRIVTLTSELDEDFDFVGAVCGLRDWYGEDEVWFKSASNNNWFYLLPNGELYEWDTISGLPHGTPLNGVLIATLDPVVHANPSLLHEPIPDSAVAHMPAGDEEVQVDFGNYRPPSIHGRKWHDLNADGVRDADEPYLNGWTVELLDESGNVLGARTTADNDLDQNGQIEPETEAGWYRFDGLVPGSYGVREVPQAGWTQSAPQPLVHEATLISGAALEDADFANYQLASIHGRKWHDLNANGQEDAGEPPLNGWTIELVDEAGQVVFTTTTSDVDRNGNGQIEPETEGAWYGFTDLVPGSYVVREVQQAGWSQSAPAELVHAVTLQSGAVLEGANFGNFALASIHGRKWHDLNANGQEDAGEPPLNGWTIELVDEAGQVVSTTTTSDMDLDGNGQIEPETEVGRYGFTDLPPGSYVIREVQQAGWLQSSPKDLVHKATVESGSVIASANFGNYQLASIHGRKWNDLNGNGTRETNEPFLNGWTIELLGADAQVVATAVTADHDLNDDGRVDAETETGSYWFDGIVPGSYGVREVRQDGWVPSAPANPLGHEILVASGKSVENVNFGNTEMSVNILEVTPNPRAGAVESITIVFSHTVSGFDVADLQLLLTNDTTVDIPLQSATLSTTDRITWTLDNLGGLTLGSGIFALILDPAGSGIVDADRGSVLVAGSAILWINGPGDADLNGNFNQLDIVSVLQQDKFLQSLLAIWSEGDWNGNNLFDFSDLDAALEPGHYLQGLFGIPTTGIAEADDVFGQLGSGT